jgi:hypothetical protein
MEPKDISKTEQIKEFIVDHKKQIAIGCGLALLYDIGYKRGNMAALKVVNADIDNWIKSGAMKCINRDGFEVIPSYTYKWF